jgi:hypothetical protein
MAMLDIFVNRLSEYVDVYIRVCEPCLCARVQDTD